DRLGALALADPAAAGLLLQPAAGLVRRQATAAALQQALGNCRLQRLVRGAAPQGAHDGSGPAPAAAPVVERALGGAGMPLDTPVRRMMEGTFAVDFGSVRIHTGADAA